MSETAIPAGDPPAAPDRLRDFQTRFLYPFFFERRGVRKALAVLQTELFSGRQDRPLPLWDRPEPHHLYTDELLDQVVQFLFGSIEKSSCGHLRIADAAAHAWFTQTELELSDGSRVPVGLVAGPRIELVFSPQGVGVLSVSLTPGQRELPLTAALDFNYRLAQFRRRPVARIRKQHPREFPNWEGIAPEHRARIPSAPEDQAPLPLRLGTPGGSFTLEELIGFLLEPLKKVGFRPVQPELSVYTVARFDSRADFGDATIRARLAPFLSALAQVEEPHHAGMARDRMAVPDALLNRRHWAAVGLLGAAHLTADQGGVQFDEQKLPIIRDKYYVPFLLALLQRGSLNQGIEAASNILGRSDADARTELVHLRDDLMRFAIEGHFTQVSTRHALHRFYQIAREGLDIPTSWQEVRRAIADLDARFNEEHQSQMTTSMANNLHFLARVQRIAGWIEIFVISIYAGHLWYMLTDQNKLLPDTHLFHWVVHGGVLLITLLAFGIATWIIKPWRHKEHPPG